MPDPSAVDAALVAKLLGDPTLMALVPDGVYFDQAKPDAGRFVIVKLLYARDEAVFGQRAFEDALYLVKAVMRSTSGGNIIAAAQRLDTLLEDGTLSPIGYGLMTMHRTERVRNTEVDDLDRSIRYEHRGGHYRVQVAPI